MSLRDLLYEIGKELNKDDLEDLIFICGGSGQGSIPESSLEKCQRPINLLKYMESHGLIDEKDCSYLTSKLQKIGRIDLANKLQEHEKEASCSSKNGNTPGGGKNVGLVHSKSFPDGAAKQQCSPSLQQHRPSSSTGNMAKSNEKEPPKLKHRINSAPGTASKSLEHQFDNLKLTPKAVATNETTKTETVPKIIQDDQTVASPKSIQDNSSTIPESTVEKVLQSSPTFPDYKDIAATIPKVLEHKLVQPEDDLAEDSCAPGNDTAVKLVSEVAGRDDASQIDATVSATDEETDSVGQQVQLYSYQAELARDAVNGENTIICAPTGSGKTLTAAHVCRILYDTYTKHLGTFKGLFIVPIRTLVSQQCEEFRKVFPDNPNVIIPIAETDRLKNVIEGSGSAGVMVFLTAQILVNSLIEGDVSIRAFNFIVMDECHHTTLEHPFNQIMRFYLKEKKINKIGLPQILGLTASLGVGKGQPLDHYIKLCAKLDSLKIAHVRENMEELLKHNPKPKQDQIISVDPRESSPFRHVVETLMAAVENSEPLKQRQGLPLKGTQHYENFVVNELKAAESLLESKDTVSACRCLRIFNDALLTFDFHRAIDALNYIDENLEHDSLHSEYEQWLIDSYVEKRPRLLELTEDDQNPMLERLLTLLEKLLTSNENSSTNPPKGLLLTRRRKGVDYLLDFIRGSHLSDKCQADFLTGQTKEGMTDSRQKNVIKRFKEKEGTNLLIATDVAQEGLDIPRCNFVVRYNFVSSEIGSVQSKGRARAKESECYLIVAKGSTDERREYANLVKEHRMMEALLEIDLIDSTKLTSDILKEQKILMEDLVSTKRTSSSASLPTTGIVFVCRKCKSLLCSADSLRKKGGHYICTQEGEFKERVVEKQYSPDKRKEYRTDINIGATLCKECMSQVGQILRYKESLRRTGYVIGKDNVMFKEDNGEKYYQIKKWNKLPFLIPEEKVFD